jgi:SAM-dependent methyltransferase
MNDGALLAAATAPYRRAGRFAYHFARGKLRGDPLYRALLRDGLLRDRASILDLGCGQGLIAASLLAAAECERRGTWPEGWAPAPRPTSIRGIELRPRAVGRARRAFGAGIEIREGDIRLADFGRADVVLLLDVLQYLEPASQRQVLCRARAALPEHGLMLLRVGDARAGWRFHCTRLADQCALAMRGQWSFRQHCRSVVSWRALLADCGFGSEIRPMSRGTPFANVLIVATTKSPPPLCPAPASGSDSG